MRRFSTSSSCRRTRADGSRRSLLRSFALELAGTARAGADHGVLHERRRQLAVGTEDLAPAVAAPVSGVRGALLQQVPLSGGAALVVRERVAEHTGRKSLVGKTTRQERVAPTMGITKLPSSVVCVHGELGPLGPRIFDKGAVSRSFGLDRLRS